MADETWYGGKPSNRHGHKRGQGGQGKTDKTPILSLVSRETGEVRSRVIPDVSGDNLREVLVENVDVDLTDLHIVVLWLLAALLLVAAAFPPPQAPPAS